MFLVSVTHRITRLERAVLSSWQHEDQGLAIKKHGWGRSGLHLCKTSITENVSSPGVQTERMMAVVIRLGGWAPRVLAILSLTVAQQTPFLHPGSSGKTNYGSSLVVWPWGPAYHSDLPMEALQGALLTRYPTRSHQSLLEHLLGSGEGCLRRDSHMRHHAHPFPGAAIRSPHWTGGGDGDIEVCVIHVVGLWRLAAPTGHFPDDQSAAQTLHDIGEFLCRTGCYTAGQNDHSLLGAIAFTCKREGTSR